MFMKKMIILVILIFLITINTYAFELVEVEVEVKDTTKYSLGLEHGSLLGDEEDFYYYGLSAAYKMNNKTYIKAVVGKTSDLSADKMKLLVLAKPMYCFTKDMNFKLYGFGLLGNFGDNLSLGGGIGYERYRMYGELAYITDQYVILSGGYSLYF